MHKPAGVPPELLERCLKQGAPKKKAAPAPTATPSDASADKLVIAQLEVKEAREKCVRSAIAKHRAEQKKTTPAAEKKTEKKKAKAAGDTSS